LPTRHDDRLEVRVVEVEGVRGDAVEQGSAGDVELFCAAEQRGLGRRSQSLHCGQRGLHGFVLRWPDGTADPVGERAVGFGVDRIAPAARRVLDREAGQIRRDGRGVGIGADGAVACHGGVSCR